MQPTTNNMEIWKDIEKYNGIYQVSDLGNVRRVYKCGKIKVLKPSLSSNGYLCVGLCINCKNKTTSIHSLIASHFLQITGSVVNHKDGNKENNSISNLEWVTVRENTCHALKKLNKSSLFIGVSWHKRRKSWAAYSSINKIKTHIGCFISQEEAYNAKTKFDKDNGIKNKYA
jgi:hypothetical protein